VLLVVFAGEESEGEEESHNDGGLSKHMQDLAMQTADLKKRAADLKDKERRLDESLKAAAAASEGEKTQPNASTVTALTLALPTLTKAPAAVAATEATRNATCPSSSARVATLLATLKQGFTLSSEELERTEGMINEAQSKYNESAGTALQEQKERDDEARKAAKQSMARIEDDEKEALHIIHAEVAVAKSKSAGAHHLLSKEREIKESDELSEQKAHVRDAVSEIESALESRLAALRAQRRTVADTLADARKKRDSVLQDVQSVLSSAALSIRSKRGAIAKMAVVAGDLLSASARIEAGLKKDLSVAADHFKHHAAPVSSARSAGDTAKEEGVTDATEKPHGATKDIHHFGLSPTEEEISKIKSAIVATDVNEDHVEAVHTAAAAHAISSDAAALNSGLAAAKTTADGFALVMGVNHLGHYALTGLVLDRLLSTPSSRVVTVSSGAHGGGKINLDTFHTVEAGERNAYGDSKLANILFTLELQRKFDNPPFLWLIRTLCEKAYS
jgi:NAD(P)-dependent dehydrogenase (short-subunit alcohol dehydrogenase family)